MPQLQHETCTVPGCTRPHKARGYCQTHYAQWKRGVEIMPVIRTRDRNPPELCTEPGCSSPVQAKGLCQMHYARLLRYGHTTYRDRKKPPKTCSVDGCDNWLYAKDLCASHYQRQKSLAEKFGMTMEDEAVMLAAQGGVCAVCGGYEKKTDARSQKQHTLSIDHCHTTGKVRGILCSHCNRAIGLLGDDPATLRRAADYLERSVASPPPTS